VLPHVQGELNGTGENGIDLGIKYKMGQSPAASRKQEGAVCLPVGSGKRQGRRGASWCIGPAATCAERPARSPVLTGRERVWMAVSKGARWCAGRAAADRNYRRMSSPCQ
jgi:hypothetical protein